MTYNEYMYERSYAQTQCLAADSTHTKFLSNKDKKIWENYLEIMKAQEQLENLFANNKK